MATIFIRVATAQASAAINKLSRDLKRLGTKGDASIATLNTGFSTIAKGVAGLTVTIGAFSTAMAFGEAVSSFNSINIELERMQKLIEGATGSFSAGQSVMNQIMDFATRAPFSIDALADSFVKLKISGLDPLGGSLQTITDSVAAFGGTSEDLKLTTIALQQMAGKGVVSMEELRRQLGERVPTAIRDMAEGLGVSYKQLVDTVSTGNQAAIPAIKAMLGVWSEKYAGHANLMMQTMTGSAARLGTAWKRLNKKLGDTGIWASLTEAVNSFTDSLIELGNSDEVLKLFDSMAVSVKDAVKNITDNKENIKSFFTSIVAGADIALKAVKLLSDSLIAINEWGTRNKQLTLGADIIDSLKYNLMHVFDPTRVVESFNEAKDAANDLFKAYTSLNEVDTWEHLFNTDKAKAEDAVASINSMTSALEAYYEVSNITDTASIPFINVPSQTEFFDTGMQYGPTKADFKPFIEQNKKAAKEFCDSAKKAMTCAERAAERANQSMADALEKSWEAANQKLVDYAQTTEDIKDKMSSITEEVNLNKLSPLQQIYHNAHLEAVKLANDTKGLVKYSDDYYDTVKLYEKALLDAAEASGELARASNDFSAGFAAGIEEIKRNFMTLGEVGYQAALTIKDAWDSSIDEIVSSLVDGNFSHLFDGIVDIWKSALKEMLSAWLQYLLQMAAAWTASEIGKLIGGGFGNLLSGFGNFLSGYSGGGSSIGAVYNAASLANSGSGMLGGPSTASLTVPISQYASGQLGLGSGTLGTNLMTGAHALYEAATTGVGSISSWYAGLQAAANGVNAGTSLALIEGSYGPAAEVVGTQIGATAGEEMAATLANTTVDFSIDAAGGYAASTGGSAASTSAGAGTAGWASAGWAALPLVGGAIWMGLENATDDRPAEQAYKNWGLNTGSRQANLVSDPALVASKWTEQFQHVFDFATQGFGNLADMSHQLGAAMDVQHVQQYVSTLAGVNVSMEQSTQVMALAHGAAQGNEAAFNQLYETLNGMMQATGDSTEYASASAYGLVQAMIDAGQATDATIAELNGITQEMIDQQAAADALTDAMVASGIATEDTADQISAAYSSGIEAVEQYIQRMNGLDDEWISSADVMDDVRAAASGGAGALQKLINDLESTGLSSTQAAQAAQAMTEAVRRFSNTNLDLEATARLRVEVEGAARASSSISGNTSFSSSSYFGGYDDFDPYDPYGDAEGSAVGGIMTQPTFFAPGHYGGEAGAEGIIPLHKGKDTLKYMDEKLDRILGSKQPIENNIKLKIVLDGKELDARIIEVTTDRVKQQQYRREVHV